MRNIDNWMYMVHQTNREKGFYDYEKDIELLEGILDPPFDISEIFPDERDALQRVLADYKRAMLERKLLLVIGEICEAHEELRNGHAPQDIYRNEGSEKPEGFPVEMADAQIRLLDVLQSQSIAHEDVMTLKHNYNTTREYKHGKKF